MDPVAAVAAKLVGQQQNGSRNNSISQCKLKIMATISFGESYKDKL